MRVLGRVRFLVVGVWTFVAATAIAFAQTPSVAEALKPITVDDSCEFGYVPAQLNFWDSPEVKRRQDNWVSVLVAKAVQHCKNGDLLMLGRGGPDAQGYVHDFFTVAALLCRRQEIQETRKPRLSAVQSDITEFRCTIKKLDTFKAKAARGEPLFKWPDDFVDPRPGDDVPRPTAQRQAFVPPAKAASSDCKDPTAALYAERCGISIMAPAK